jgi:hypothetical protein
MEEIRRASEQRYDWASEFHEGRAKVELNGKYGFIDSDGNKVAPLIYDSVWSYQEGWARVCRNRKHGFIDLDGNKVIPCWYDSVQRHPYGFMATLRVSVHDIEHIYFDLDGNLIKEPDLTISTE